MVSSRRLRSLAGAAAGLVLLGLFVRSLGVGQVERSFLRADPLLIPVGAVIALGSLAVLGLAWRSIVAGVADLGPWEGVKVFLAANVLNAVTPFGQLGGEPFIAYVLSRETDLPYERGLGAAMAADILNTLPFFTLSLVGILLFVGIHAPGPAILHILYVILLLLVLLVGGVVLLWMGRDHVIEVASRLGHRVAKRLHRWGLVSEEQVAELEPQHVAQRGENFYQTLAELGGDRRGLVWTLLLNHAAALLNVVALGVLLLALEPTGHLRWVALLYALPASMVGNFLPMPGGLGGVEVIMASLVAAGVGVPLAMALAAVVLFRLFNYGGSLVMGGLALSRLSAARSAEARTSR